MASRDPSDILKEESIARKLITHSKPTKPDKNDDRINKCKTNGDVIPDLNMNRIKYE